MAETFDNPLKNLLLDKMISDGYFKRDNLDKSTIQTISDLKDSEVLQLLKSFGVGPKIVKKDGGIVQMSNGGDPLLGKLVEKLKNKPKLASATETMTDVMDALGDKDVITTRPSSGTSLMKENALLIAMGFTSTIPGFKPQSFRRSMWLFNTPFVQATSPTSILSTSFLFEPIIW